MSADAVTLALLGAVAAAPDGLPRERLVAIAAGAGLDPSRARETALSLDREGAFAEHNGLLRLTPRGVAALLSLHAELERALDPSAGAPGEEAPTLPWLAAIRTEWIDALCFNYAVDPDALAALLPPPLVPEVFHGHGWVQVLVSSLRDLRPRGLPALFGTNFYQASYRAAVTAPGPGGTRRRGGFFLRSETNHAFMRAIGNRLAEFRFHDFGAATMSMLREGDRLVVGIEAERPGGDLVALVLLRRRPAPPEGSLWSSLAEMHQPLVECYDAFGIDAAAERLYTLTIDRDPWHAAFVEPEHVYCGWLEAGPLGGRTHLDSVLHVERCGYRWRPLRREPIPGLGGAARRR